MTKEKKVEIRSAMNLLKSLTDSEWKQFYKEGEEFKSKMVQDRTAYILKALGIKASNPGHQYLIEAITLAVKDRLDIQYIYKKLSCNEKVAEEEIKQAIEYSIAEAYSNIQDIYVWVEIFDNTICYKDKNPPKDVDFIYEVANYLKIS